LTTKKLQIYAKLKHRKTTCKLSSLPVQKKDLSPADLTSKETKKNEDENLGYLEAQAWSWPKFENTSTFPPLQLKQSCTDSEQKCTVTSNFSFQNFFNNVNF